MRAQRMEFDERRTGQAQFGLTAVAAAMILTMSVACAQGVRGTAPAAEMSRAIASKAKLPTGRISRVSRTLHWFEVGQASWYGPHFQGKKTANGEWFDMNELTCAHRSLPLGSWIRVTNLKNKRSVFVRVNDRGPVPENRVVDLSFAAARAVGLAGIGKVKLEAVRGGDPELARALVAQLQMPVIPMPGQ